MNCVLKHEDFANETPRDYITEIPTNKIKANPYQPRKEFSRSALYDLANSIKEWIEKFFGKDIKRNNW